MADTYEVEIYRTVEVEADDPEDAVEQAMTYDKMKWGCDGSRVYRGGEVVLRD